MSEELVGVGQRIGYLVEKVGGKKLASDISGVSSSTLARWISEESSPIFLSLAHLAEAAGESLDWIATGKRASVDSPHQEGCFYFVQDSHNMSPFIKKDDMVLIQEGKALSEDGVYLLSINERKCLKRVQREVNGFSLINDSTDYPSRQIGNDELGDIEVLGKVVWKGSWL